MSDGNPNQEEIDAIMQGDDEQKEEQNTEVLSQEEIDSLLTAISTGEIECEEEHYKQHENIEDYAGRLISMAATSTRHPVNIQIVYKGKELVIKDAALVNISQVDNKETSIVRIILEKKNK